MPIIEQDPGGGDDEFTRDGDSERPGNQELKIGWRV